MSKFTPGFKGPMTPAAGPRPRTPIATPTTVGMRPRTPIATPVGGMRPPGMGTTGGPKPAPGGLSGAILTGNNPRMKKGGEVKHSDVKMDKKVVKKAVGMHEKQLHGGKKSNLTKLKAGGMTCGTKRLSKGGGIETKGKTKGRMC